jgi:hypothetical protein
VRSRLAHGKGDDEEEGDEGGGGGDGGGGAPIGKADEDDEGDNGEDADSVALSTGSTPAAAGARIGK